MRFLTVLGKRVKAACWACFGPMPEEHHEKHKLKVVIRNGSSRALHFSWVEPDGGRTSVAKLQAGEVQAFSNYSILHGFAAHDAKTGEPVELDGFEVSFGVHRPPKLAAATTAIAASC